jgi:DNA adenine methylase
MIKPLRKTPLSYYGGKQRMLQYLLPLIPEHRLYTEAFIGGAALFWAKAPSEVEVINDLNYSVSTFWRVLKTEYNALKAEIEMTLHSRDGYADALHVLARPHLFDDVKVAWAIWAGCVQGFGSKPESWGYDLTGSTNKKMGNKIAEFGPHLATRLSRTQVECNDALRVIASRDCADAFHYIDPPYFNSACGHYTGYSEQDFRNLLELLATVKGKFLLSSYPSDILIEFTALHGWNTREIEQTVAVTGKRTGKKLKIEVLTANYPIG